MTEWIAAHELWFLAVPIPLLIFPNPAAPLALIGVAFLWLIRWVARGHITVRTPVDVPIIGLLVMIPAALYASVDLAKSWIILYQVIAGMALFYGLVNALRLEKDVWRMAFLLVLGGGGLALIAPFGTTWRGSKLLNLPAILLRVPRLLPDVIHYNVLAGALILIIPVGLSLLLRPRWSYLAGGGVRIYKMALGLALVLIVAITVLTQSRGGYVALAVGMLLFAIVVNRWFLVLGLAAGLGVAAVIRFVGIETLAELLLTTDALGGWAGREEVWSRAIYMIQDFPYTGIGLGTFGKVGPVMYPYFLAGPNADIPHAHNLFLQVAVDLGLPGLVAFVGLFGGALMAAWKAYRAYGARKEAGPRGLALGLLISLVIMGIHGLTDAVTWGTKPAIVPWCIMGLTMALYRVSEEGQGRMDEGQGKTDSIAQARNSGALDKKKELKYNWDTNCQREGRAEGRVGEIDVYIFERKVAFYERRQGVKVDYKIIITPMLDPRAQPVVDELGIRVYASAYDFNLCS
jgi:putative inorganic carbon (HCO3(-)) transporter